jgi:hypothetical protein
MNRRNLLKFFSAAPAAPAAPAALAAAPALAEKALLDTGILASTGITVGRSIAEGAQGGCHAPSIQVGRNLPALVSSLMQHSDLRPPFFDEEMRVRHSGVYNLDPDIANKRSWSMAVKIATQRERNLKIGTESVFTNQLRRYALEEFARTTGWWI